MRSDWVDADSLSHVLAALMPANRLACEISMATGMRIGDVLSITAEQVRKQRFSYHEAKTGKVRRVRLSNELQRRALASMGNVYLFPSRSDGKRHRTRQAVYRDIRRAAKAFRLLEHVSPHSMRKFYAVNQFNEHDGDIDAVRRNLNHDRDATTMIYVLADALTAKRIAKLGHHAAQEKSGGKADAPKQLRKTRRSDR